VRARDAGRALRAGLAEPGSRPFRLGSLLQSDAWGKAPFVGLGCPVLRGKRQRRDQLRRSHFDPQRTWATVGWTMLASHTPHSFLAPDTSITLDRCRPVRALCGALLTRRTSERASLSKV
jgi:hypothetical protein